MSEAGWSATDTNRDLYILTQLETGVSGLDIVMAGGLLKRATHLITGAPGSGKTILAHQIANHLARKGEQILYLTLLSESHEKMLTNLSNFAFFDKSLVGNKIYYLSLYSEVAAEGLSKLSSITRQAMMQQKATFVIVDGISTLRDFADSRAELRKALFDLNTQLSALGNTVLLLTEEEPYGHSTPEFAIADSIIRLSNQTHGRRHMRSLEVLKSRAIPALPGHHYFDITFEGLQIYPRVESWLGDQRQNPPPARRDPRLSFGIENLDKMLNGGLYSSSISLMVGTPGSGKTMTSLHFIYEGLRKGEKALILTTQSSEEQIIASTRALGFDLKPFLESGQLKTVWVLPVDRTLDEVAGKLINAVEKHQPKRLLLDALSDLENLNLSNDPLSGFWAVLCNYLRNREITTIGLLEMNQIVGRELIIPERPISIIADTIILLHTYEADGQLKRLISILEMRDSSYDSQVYEYLIRKEGLKVGEPLTNVESILGGAARFTQ
ncbi:MAG TPA: ATPase domain-containing protein [Chloroflexia bacterium]|nr:ATPase domain-containing protein [Chloroflexia bacterium]